MNKPRAQFQSNPKPKSHAGAFIVLAVIGVAILGGAYYVGQQAGTPPAARQAQRVEDGLGWGSELAISKPPGRPATLRLMIRDPKAQPVTGAMVKAAFTQPGVQGSLQITLGMQEPGVYRGELPLPQGGLWNVHVTVQAGANAYQLNEQYTFPN